MLSNPQADAVKYAVVSGTSGAGKSVLLYYVMWKLIKQKNRVLFMTRKPPIYFDGSTVWEFDLLPRPGDRQFWSPDLWCLVYSVDPIGMD